MLLFRDLQQRNKLDSLSGSKSGLYVFVLIHRKVLIYMFSPGIKATSNVFNYNIMKNALILYILFAFWLEWYISIAEQFISISAQCFS